MNFALHQSHCHRALRPAARAGRRSVAARTATVDAAAQAPPPQPGAAGGAPPSGLQYLSEAAKERALAATKNKFEKVKAEKCGSTSWTEVHELAAKLREGTSTWEDLNLDDVDVRMKFAGLFHRAKRTPKRFMMRLKLPNGEVTSSQLRHLAGVLAPCAADGCADITTRANLQIRGVRLEEADAIVAGLIDAGMSSIQSGMDSVRNLTGSPIAGIDPHELLDVRPLLRDMNAALFNGGRGNAEFANLPRKINVCVSPSRDDFPHTQINDLAYEAVPDAAAEHGVRFNVLVGGYFSLKRNIMSVPLGVSLEYSQLIPFTLNALRVFRDFGPRADRQKTRLIWCIEELGFEGFTAKVAEYMGVPTSAFGPHAHVAHDDAWERRDLLGAGLFWVGASVPAGRLQGAELAEIARVADKYGDGTVRLTCEENVLFPNVPEAALPAMLAEPLFAKFKANPGNLERGLVSCTGSQFCGFALIETKNRAMAVVEKLEAALDIPKAVRIHWTGCPNSCGQAQVGEQPALAEELEAGVPLVDEVLLPKLTQLLVEHFGATPKAHAAA
ncbi:hypothetical protein Rsub_09383 [Raphidocelis subcapitata]|uniref:Ferredoxin--nitrite reductase, chloroplastic n=1 Tax=Raphidocelis subcapitata TaxID=307507 RepID=A0A2V0PHD8_9CHLO|nr:hypothetical protein Rsub_09383 [Raphidocelis subcapitata]|eukprot:GBF96637.1 hypothetical protein Rsub_09383 [Raphidocelis subcapitata]